MPETSKSESAGAQHGPIATPIIHGIQPPTGLNLTGKNKAVNWKIYKQQWKNYAVVTNLPQQTEEYRVALFLYSIGTDAVKTFNSFDMTDDQRKSLDEIIKRFDTYAIGETNETYERYVFNSRNQKDGENVDKYVTELRTLAQSCNFCTCLHDSLIRDRLVLGIRDPNTRKRLLRQTKLTLQKCIEIIRSDEVSTKQIKDMDQASGAEDVHKVKTSRRSKDNKAAKATPQTSNRKGGDSSRRTKDTKQCAYCGRTHKTGRDNCPAWGQTCRSCGKKNHFSKQCKQEKAHSINDETDGESSDPEYSFSVTVKQDTIHKVNATRVENKQIYANMVLNEKKIKFHVDCGATVNVLPKKYVQKVELQPTKRVLQMWNKSKLKPEGTCKLIVTNPKNDRKYDVKFMVVKQNLTPLLGARAIQEMGLIEVHTENFETICATKETKKQTAQQIITEYKDVFEGELGTLAGKQHLTVDPTVSPSVAPSRRVPFAVKPKLKTELERLTELGVLAPVDEPTSWVSNLVIATKESGELRLCLDPKQLNKALQRERYPLPVIEDVLPDLARAKVFTKVDARNGYWHVQLDQESSLLTTFDTPFGRFRWRRLPFGVSVASEIFQKRLNQALDRLDGLLTVHDDMVIYGVGDTEDEAIENHNRKLKVFLKRCRETGVKLNKRKLKLLCKEIPYLGHLVTAEGLKPDPEKVEAVKSMPKPDNVKAVRRFCGFVNYLAKFLPRLAQVLEPIQQLTQSEVEWNWSHEHDATFKKVRELMTTAPLLKYYNPEEELTVQCDASDKGLGAALMQKGQPIAFASRALTDPETRYAQIEKEMLAVVFALQKFDQYVYGRSVTVESDHKPLAAIAVKPLRSAPKRLQGMLLKVQKYDVQIVYKPGPEMYLADTLSRAYLPTTQNTQGEFERVNAVKYLPMTDAQLEQLKTATFNDEAMQQLKEVIQSGWPEDKKTLPAMVGPYHSYRDELSVYDGLVFKGERLLIPKSIRQAMKELLHSSHTGVNACLRRARECMFWPGMTSDIKEYVSQCETCASYSTKQQKETLMSHDATERPWEKVGADLYTIDGKEYLVIVDYFSNFWEIDLLPDTKASTVIKKLKCHFARHGIPDTVISDNGPQFACDNFKEFAAGWGFDHCPGSPGHQQTNGKSEAAVKEAKRLIKKVKKTGGDIYLGLLDLRNTPTESMDSSPAQRLLGRRCKTQLPTTKQLLRPQTIQPEKVKKETRAKQHKQATYYNRGARDLTPLEEGDVVRMRPFRLGKKEWDKATVVKRYDERSYEVETEEGSYRRNRADLKQQPTPAPPPASVPQKDTPPSPSDEPIAAEPAANTKTKTAEPKDVATSPPAMSRPKRSTREPAWLKDFVK